MEFTGQWSVIIVSSVLAALPFLFSFYCAELTFIYLVPLLWFSQKKQYLFTFKQGCFWGLIFFTIFFFDIYIYIMQHGNHYVRFYVILFLISYNTFLCGCWFYISKIFSNFRIGFSHLSGWLLSTYFFWLFVDYFYFIPFGLLQGIVFAHKSVPLAIRAPWIFLLKYSGKELFLLFVLIVNGGIAYCMIYKRIYYFLSMIGCIILFFMMLSFHTQKFLPDWFRDFGCLCVVQTDHDPTTRAEKIMRGLAIFEERFENIKYIIMPESTFPFPLNIFKKYCSLWHISPEKRIFLGSHRSHGQTLYNTLYCIENGTITALYDKKHPMFFTEYIPKFWNDNSELHSLFLKDKVPFAPGEHTLSLVIPQIGAADLLICSDLFFRPSALPSYRFYICIANDSLFYHRYPSNLMFLYAKASAVLCKSIILYCAYNYCEIITPSGAAYPLTTVRQN